MSSFFDVLGDYTGRIVDRAVEYGLEKEFPMGEPNPTPTATSSQTQQEPSKATPPPSIPVNVVVPQVPQQPSSAQAQPNWMMPAMLGVGALLLIIIVATGRR